MANKWNMTCLYEPWQHFNFLMPSKPTLHTSSSETFVVASLPPVPPTASFTTTPAPPLLIASMTASRFSMVFSRSCNSAIIFLSISSFSARLVFFSSIKASCLLINSCLSLMVCSSFSTLAFVSSRALLFSSSFFLRTRSFPRVAASSPLSP